MDSYTEKMEAGAVGLYEYNAIEKLPGIIASFREGILSCITEGGIPVQLNYEGDGS